MISTPVPPNSSTSTDFLPDHSLGDEEKNHNQVLSSEAGKIPRLTHAGSDIILLTAILVMLTWPWIFFGVVWTKTKHRANDTLFENILNGNYFAAILALEKPGKSGIPAASNFAEVVKNNPETVTFVITFIGTAVSLIVGTLFSLSVLRFSQEWVADNKEFRVFHVVLLTGFRQKSFPWRWKDLKRLSGRNKRFAVLTVAAYLGAMSFVTSSITGLLYPVKIVLAEGLSWTEVDFSANSSECLKWFADVKSELDNSGCQWQSFHNLTYNTCLGQNQMIDALESGQVQTLSLITGVPENVTFTKISDHVDLRFSGPVRGILPAGPNGAFALTAIDESSDEVLNALIVADSYNYVLVQQGLTSSVSCSYEAESPIEFFSLDGDSALVLASLGNCSLVGAVDFLTNSNSTSSVEINGEQVLASWACQSKSQQGQGLSYDLHLRTLSDANDEIGNITCAVSPLQPAIFPVEYDYDADIFTVYDPAEFSQFNYTGFSEDLFFAITDIISSAQNFQSNIFASIVNDSAVKYSDLTSTSQDDAYLLFFEAMIQGVLDYEAAYNRLIYTAASPQAPPTCTRRMDGSLSYELLGWSVSTKHIFFLLPMTLVNLVSLSIMLVVIFLSRGNANPELDPTDPRQLIYSSHSIHPEDDDEWEDRTTYWPRERTRLLDLPTATSDKL